LATSPKYQANINGNLRGFAQGDNAKVIINYQSSNKPDKRELFEIGYLCAFLCLKDGSASKREKIYNDLIHLITTTDLADIFPGDVISYLLRDLTLNGVKDILSASITTCDRIAEGIKRKYGKRDGCHFRVGFNLYVSQVIVNTYTDGAFLDVLDLIVRDLLSSLRSLGRKKDRETAETIVVLVKNRKKSSIISERLRTLQENYIYQFNKTTVQSKKV
jgi:hypothetical protein